MNTISFSTLLRLLVSMILGLGVSVAQAAAFQEITQYAYDANGNLTRVIDPLSQPTDHRYDSLDRPLATQDALGGQIHYEYDALDRLTTVADPLGLITRYALDGLGDEREATSPDSGRTQNSYDEAGNLTTTTDARGHTLRYAYDALNRLTRIDVGQGGPIILRYDQGPNAVGRLSSLADESGESTWQYDSLGRVTTHTIERAEASLTLQYTYDANGRLREIVYPSGQRLGLDWQNGKISDLTLNGMALLRGIQYRPFGPPSGWEWGNGRPYQRSFDLDGRPQHYSLSHNERSLDYDAASRILGYTDTDPAYGQRFAYDALHRLLQAENTQGSQSFGYDGNGNRISQNGQPYAYAQDTNRLQATGSAAYAYDESGNVLSDGHRHFTYDAFGRLQQADDGTTSFQYQYDGFGVRAAKWQGSAPDMAGDIDRDGRFSVLDGRKLVLMAQGELTPAYNADCDHDASITTQDALCVMRKAVDQRQHSDHYNQPGILFLYDSAGHLLGEYRRDGQPIRETVWLYDQPVAVLQPSAQNPLLTETYLVYADHLKAPRAIVDAADKLVWRWEAEPFGNTPAEEDPDGDGQRFEYNLRFPGQYRDPETGLHYNLARYYNPAIGRYMQPDPIGLAGDMNPYAYVGGNPVSRADPEGLFWDILDLGFFASSLYNYQQCPSTENAINVGLDALGLLPGLPALGTVRHIGKLTGAAKEATASASGGLNLFKWSKETTTKPGGWKEGDFMLHLPEQSSAKASWAQNASRLREQMRQGNPIHDSYRDPLTGQQIPTQGFLRAERYLLESRGWQYNPSTGAYYPPGF